MVGTTCLLPPLSMCECTCVRSVLCHENNTVVSSTHMFQKLRMKAAFRVGSVLCHEQRFFLPWIMNGGEEQRGEAPDNDKIAP